MASATRQQRENVDDNAISSPFKFAENKIAGEVSPAGDCELQDAFNSKL